MSDPYDFFRDLTYIPIDPETKHPLVSGFGWTEDEETRAEATFTWDERLEYIEENDGHCGWAWLDHVDHNIRFGIIDIDWSNMAEAEDAPNPEDVDLGFSEPLPKVETRSVYEGEDGEEYQHAHYLFAYAGDEDFSPTVEGVDLKGEINHGFGVCPNTPGYEMANEYGLPIFVDPENVESLVKLGGENLLEIDSPTSDRTFSGSYTGPGGNVYDLLDPTQYPEGENRPHPYHPSSTGGNFKVFAGGETFYCFRHDVAGNLGHLVGMHTGICECGEWDDEGLSSDQWQAIFTAAEENGIDIESDAIDLSPFVTTNERDEPVILDAPPLEWDWDEPLSLEALARGGKSWALVSLIKKAYLNGFQHPTVFVCPSHDEGEATLRKFQSEETGSVGACTVSHYVGRDNERMRDVPAGGDYRGDIAPRTPDQAAQYDRGNVYQAYREACLSADVIICPPALLPDVLDHVDPELFVTAEEGVMKAMKVGTIKLLEAQPNGPNDRTITYSLSKRRDTLRGRLENLQALEQHDEHHRAVITACQALLEIIEVIGDFTPGTWGDVHREWPAMKEEIDRIIRDMPDFDVSFNKIRRQSYAEGIDDVVVPMLAADGILQYGSTGQIDPENPDDDRWKRERLQMFVAAEPFTPAYELPEECTIWAGGANKGTLSQFHSLYGEAPEPWCFYSQIEDLVESDLDLLAFEGGSNPDHQTGAMRGLVRDIQRLRTDISILGIAGSSERAAQTSAQAANTMTPTDEDTLDTLRRHAKTGGSFHIPVMSRFANGVDTNFFDMGVIDHANYATPQEDYESEQLGDPNISKAWKMSDAQNAMLRVSDVPFADDNTGDTPVVVPSRHIPEELFAQLEAFGHDVKRTNDLDVLKSHLVAYLRHNGDDIVVVDGHIKHRNEEDAGRLDFADLQRQIGVETADRPPD